MYSTCIHCRQPLGKNDALEALPIGRRVAFDAKRGRLWVVCRSCERWNLTPFDARWEAIEQGERAYRDTRVRVSTDNIGLARLRDGTELVRIGEPLRPEFAAWRYGDQFGRRRRKAIATGVGLVVGAGAAVGGAVTMGLGLAAIIPVAQLVSFAGAIRFSGTLFTRLPRPDGGSYIPVGTPRLIKSDRAEWAIDTGVAQLLDAEQEERRRRGWDVQLLGVELGTNKTEETTRLALHGAEALPLLRWVLPRVNTAGARPALVRDGVQVIEDIGGPERFGTWALSRQREWAARSTFGDTGDFRQMPPAVRLAFEMAVHEDAERQAMEGELAALEQAWADAEGIAAIADTLALPPVVDERLDVIKRRTPNPPRRAE